MIFIANVTIAQTKSKTSASIVTTTARVVNKPATSVNRSTTGINNNRPVAQARNTSYNRQGSLSTSFNKPSYNSQIRDISSKPSAPAYPKDALNPTYDKPYIKPPVNGNNNKPLEEYPVKPAPPLYPTDPINPVVPVNNPPNNNPSANTNNNSIDSANTNSGIGKKNVVLNPPNDGKVECYDYLKGFKDGYKDGYCWNDIPCTAPKAPISEITIPRVRAGDCSYLDGYNRGFERGKIDKKAGIKSDRQ